MNMGVQLQDGLRRVVALCERLALINDRENCVSHEVQARRNKTMYRSHI